MTRVGYSGGTVAGPTYRRVCNNAEWADWVETVQIEYDPIKLSFAEVLDAFFRNHKGWEGQRPDRCRQYQSVIFAHDDEQAMWAAQAIKGRQHCGTFLEGFNEFYDAEAYHQKWLLQRKQPLFNALGLEEPSQLLSSRAAVTLNAFAAGRLTAARTARRLRALRESGELSQAVLEQSVSALHQFSDAPIVMFG
mmetsp:Transcript_7429/g.12564  ORF Transcript_7429/g.12564 Transcript_7429/m.12564 type:complete len:193 (-) Transcript_7429:356-934(-)|eukprot:CAMPEP_0119314650 /NCGR_PEP_ID=MMETSP1333-20130426/33533_1 /TAXON_ID=418940 /ORGANISM="Scyphosphaera apsteinii, Strain RCC1455" /LENGTH=192 /DNA_ID=CAMNT_0007319811 /DNA_START=208 /DNA_END=786 /DNA_ORIENTATION=-